MNARNERDAHAAMLAAALARIVGVDEADRRIADIADGLTADLIGELRPPVRVPIAELPGTPTGEPGVRLVNGRRLYSSAWL